MLKKKEEEENGYFESLFNDEPKYFFDIIKDDVVNYPRKEINNKIISDVKKKTTNVNNVFQGTWWEITSKTKLGLKAKINGHNTYVINSDLLIQHINKKIEGIETYNDNDIKDIKLRHILFNQLNIQQNTSFYPINTFETKINISTMDLSNNYIDLSNTMFRFLPQLLNVEDGFININYNSQKAYDNILLKYKKEKIINILKNYSFKKINLQFKSKISDISKAILFDSIGQYINTHINTNDIYIKYNIKDSYLDYLNRLVQVCQYFYNTFEDPTSIYKNQKYFKIDTTISSDKINLLFANYKSKRQYLLDNSNNFYNNINYIIEEYRKILQIIKYLFILIFMIGMKIFTILVTHYRI